MPSPITVTCTLNDPSGTGLQGNAFVRFRLRNFQGFVPRVSGTSVYAETRIDAFPNGSGLVSQNLWANSAITPGTTFYTVEFWNQGRITSSGNYLFNGNTDLGTAAQLNTPPVPSGFSLVLENNGALNSSQSTLNLTNSDGTITITDLGSGNIQLKGVPAGQFGTVGQGYFCGPGLNGSATVNNFNSQITNFGNHVVVVEQFVLNVSWTLSSCSYQLGTTGTGTFNFGIYDKNGNKLVDCQFSATTSAVQTIAISPAVTLPPGVYYFAAAASNGSSSGFGPHIQWTSTTIQQNLNSINAGGRTVIATAANAESGGVLPSTLGTLTAIVSTANYQGSAIPFWQV